jgi:hypothetical protein
MNKYQKKEFMIDLLKANESLAEKDRNLSQGLANDIMDGFMSTAPTGIFNNDSLQAFRKIPISDSIKQFEAMDVESDFFEKAFEDIEAIMGGLASVDPIQSRGYTFDPKIISNKYDEVKDQFKKYGDSQDPSNL